MRRFVALFVAFSAAYIFAIIPHLSRENGMLAMSALIVFTFTGLVVDAFRTDSWFQGDVKDYDLGEVIENSRFGVLVMVIGLGLVIVSLAVQADGFFVFLFISVIGAGAAISGLQLLVPFMSHSRLYLELVLEVILFTSIIAALFRVFGAKGAWEGEILFYFTLSWIGYFALNRRAYPGFLRVYGLAITIAFVWITSTAIQFHFMAYVNPLGNNWQDTALTLSLLAIMAALPQIVFLLKRKF